ncbi:UNVERIFIED_CONTAM: hypothetical protein HDU68_005571, partial [Siphonaria sp. JEL0065]
ESNLLLITPPITPTPLETAVHAAPQFPLGSTKLPVIKFDSSLPPKSAFCFVDEDGVLNLVTAPFERFKRLKESDVPLPKKKSGQPVLDSIRPLMGRKSKSNAHLQWTYCLGCMILHNNLDVNPENNAKIAQLKRTDPWAFLKSAADNWRNNKCHAFSQGEWNEGLQKFVPNSCIAQYFFLRLIHARAEARHFVIRSLDDIHQVPTNVEFKELKAWFLEHVDSILGAETLRRLVFLSDAGLDQASMDQRYSNLGADEIGQEWVLDGEGWNRFTNDKTPGQLADAILELRSSKFEVGTRMWNLYKRGVVPHSSLTSREIENLKKAIVLTVGIGR